MTFAPIHLRSDSPLSFNLFSSNLRFLRKRRGLNQEDISALFNKKPNTVGNWENGKTEPSIPELLVISGYFGVQLDDLLRSELARRQQESDRQLSLWPANPTEKPQPIHNQQPGIPVKRNPLPELVERQFVAGISPTRSGSIDNNNDNPADADLHTGSAGGIALSAGGQIPAGQNGSDGNAIWFVLRELRTVQERLDQLQSAFELNKPAVPRDKSDH